MLKTIYDAVINIVIPGIMLAMLIFSVYVAGKASSRYRLSAIAGLSAGLVVFAIYVVSSLSASESPQFALNRTPTFSWLPVGIGIVLGFTALFLVHVPQLRSGLIGLFTLFLAATSSVAVFSYFFASPLRDFSIFFALSALFGMLLHVALFPEGVRDVLNTDKLYGLREERGL
jgi:hypothetical protein